MRAVALGLVLLGLSACGPRHGDPLGPDWLPQPPQPVWGRTWRFSPAGPVPERTINHVADELVGIERFRACLRASRLESTVITFRWTILRDGSVRDPRLAGATEREPALERCLLTALARTRFVPAANESAAQWTFVHRARRGELHVPDAATEPEPPRSPPAAPLAPEWFRACYDAGRAVDPELNGHLAFRYLIDPAGRVSAVRDDGSRISDRDVVDCAAELLYAQRFAAHSDYRIAVRTIQLRSSPPYVIAN